LVWGVQAILFSTVSTVYGNYMKTHAVQDGQAGVVSLEQSTVDWKKRHQCDLRWWDGLAAYAVEKLFTVIYSKQVPKYYGPGRRPLAYLL